MLKTLNLKPVYDSSEHDLIRDLIVPLLLNSKNYFRGVGFFTSGWLRLASKGLVELIENAGKARIVLSPNLQESDWEAFQVGEKAKVDASLKLILERNIDDLQSALEKDTLNCLAWMIADGVLEFRFAIPRDRWFGGDYHDKVGVFIDEEENMVAIHGSFNDSVQGSLNGEAFSVFKSWEDGQRPYVGQHLSRLLSLWEDKNRQFRVYTIPDAIREKFIKLRSIYDRPYYLLSQREILIRESSDNPRRSIKLRTFQEKAIESWLSAGCRGIFEMATGTGKTFTSLAAAVNRFESLGRLALIILVPYLHLLEQWEQNCRKFGFSPILCSGDHARWQTEVQSKIQDFNLNALSNVCILAVHQTAALDRFKKAIKALKPETTMLIGDEVHGLGASKLRDALIPQVEMRLGLSATPRRWFDEDGTKLLLSYFGEVCFEFSLEEAIGRYLTPYEYLPQLVNLTSTEMDEYEELTAQITKLCNTADEDEGVRERLENLLLKRARIVASAEQKLIKLISILKGLVEDAKTRDEDLRDILIYCAPGKHKEVLKAVANLGLRCREFVHTVSLSERAKILEQFAKGEIQVLVAVKCLDEGVDVPSTRTAFFLASTTNPKEFIQRRGRVLRLAERKDRAILYDFIVVPDSELMPLKRDVDASLLKREMPRFAEFSSSAINQFEARSVVLDLLDKYEMLNLLNEKPWDVYHKLIKNKAIDGIIDI